MQVVIEGPWICYTPRLKFNISKQRLTFKKPILINYSEIFFHFVKVLFVMCDVDQLKNVMISTK